MRLSVPQGKHSIMTLQVGFLGSDGFLIASDRKACTGNYPSMQHTADTGKIIRRNQMTVFVPLLAMNSGLGLWVIFRICFPKGNLKAIVRLRITLIAHTSLANESMAASQKNVRS